MKDIPRPQLLLNFGRKTQKSLAIRTCPKKFCSQKTHLGPSGVKQHKLKKK